MQVGMIGSDRRGGCMDRRSLVGGRAYGEQCPVHDVQTFEVACGVIAAYAEGVNLLRSANAGHRVRQAQRGHDAETTTLRDPVRGRVELSLPETHEVWRRGNADFSNRALSGRRYGFGGHVERPAS